MGYTIEMPKAMYQDPTIKEYYARVLDDLGNGEQSCVVIHDQMSLYVNDLDINIIILKEKQE